MLSQNRAIPKNDDFPSKAAKTLSNAPHRLLKESEGTSSFSRRDTEDVPLVHVH